MEEELTQGELFYLLDLVEHADRMPVACCLAESQAIKREVRRKVWRLINIRAGEDQDEKNRTTKIDKHPACH